MTFQLQKASGFTLKKGIKEVLVSAFQSSFASDFWSSLSSEMGKIVPDTVVLSEYPTQAYNHFPFVKVSVNLRSAVWTSINSTVNDGLERAFTGEGTCFLDIWSLSAPMRDTLFDSLMVLLLLRQNTGADLFDSSLTEAWTSLGYPRILPKYATVSMQADDDGTGLPWAPSLQLYTSGMSFDFEYIQSFSGLNEGLKVSEVKAIPNIEK